MRFRRGESRDQRPAFSCCSISLSLSCCSLPAFVGLLLAGLLAWLGLRAAREAQARQSAGGAVGRATAA